MRLEMRSQWALIGMESRRAEVTIEQQRAELEIRTTHASLEMKSENPKLLIDQTQAFSDAGLKSAMESVREMAALSRSAALENTRITVEQGNALADIQDGGDPISDQADYNAFERNNREFGQTGVSFSGPDITVIEGSLDIKVNEGHADVTITPRKPEITYQAGKLDIYLRQRNSLTITVVEDRFDRRV